MTNSAVSELEELAEHLEAYDKDIKNREKELEERRKIDSEKKTVLDFLLVVLINRNMM